ncbi:MAG: DNA recombination protein RmuC [Paracoccaceae bacterium]
MNTLDFPVLTFFAVVIVGIIVLIAMIRRTPPDQTAVKGELERLTAERTVMDDALRTELSRAARSEGLAEERKTEIDRLNGDLSKLRTRMDMDREEQQVLLAAKSGLEAKATSEFELATSKSLELQTSAREITQLRGRLEEEQKSQQALTDAIARLETQIKAQKLSGDEKIALLSSVREDMQAKFKQLADDALKSQGDAFSKANIEKLEATLSPLKEHVGHFEKELREVHQETVKDRERLKAEITQLSKRSEEISTEAVNLTRALKGDHQQQGAWGEMILETILERSGLREGEEYETQAHRVDADGGRLKPDVVVRIPGNKTLVIDSKVSLVAYAEAVNSEDPTVIALARKRHVASVRSHINGLSAKGYQLAEGSTVDYVIMFIPIEGALSEALREDGALTEYALERHITIATPTTLMMALRTVSHVWAVERRNSNAETIAKRAGLLYDKMAGFVLNMEKVGKGLGSAHTAYEGAIGQLSRGPGNVLAQIAMLKGLGAKTSKEIALDFDADTMLAIEQHDIEPEAVAP